MSEKGFQAFLTSREFMAALRMSIVVSLSAVTVGVCAGVPTAFAIKRFSFPGRNAVNTLVMSSMTLPQVIWAIALLQFYSILGILGTYAGLILAHSLLVIPYVVRMVLSSLSFVGPDVESAALSLRASPVQTFFKITLPLISPGVIVSAFSALWSHLRIRWWRYLSPVCATLRFLCGSTPSSGDRAWIWKLWRVAPSSSW